LQLGCKRISQIQVCRDDRPGKPVVRIVSELNRFISTVNLEEVEDWTEKFLVP
jgi:hypothetical protein